MDIGQVPAALQERLGVEATSGLLQLFDRAHGEGRADVMAACTDRFERRLVEEISGVRVQIAQVDASIRRDMAEMGAGIRRDIAAMGASIRQDMARVGADIRQEITGIRQEMTGIRQEMSGIRQEMTGIRHDVASGRVELLKWCFLFWVGQVAAVAAIMGMMLRFFRP
jgi:hypothetical protein